MFQLMTTGSGREVSKAASSSLPLPTSMGAEVVEGGPSMAATFSDEDSFVIFIIEHY